MYLRITLTATAHRLLRQQGDAMHSKKYEVMEKNDKGEMKVVSQATRTRTATTDVYEHTTPDGKVFREHIRKDGTLAVREDVSGSTVTAVRYYDGEGKQQDIQPTLFKVIHGPVEMDIPKANGSTESTKSRYEKGIYVLHDGKAIAPYRSPIDDFGPRLDAIDTLLRQANELESTGQTSQAKYIRNEAAKLRSETIDAQLLKEQVRLQEHFDFLAKTLRTPEAIASYVSSSILFVGHGNVWDKEAAFRARIEKGNQDHNQHPLMTIMLGSGDCEDFAILMRALCVRAHELLGPGAGAPDMLVGRITPDHVGTFFIDTKTDKDSNKTYDLCILDSRGFNRKSGFSTPELAMRAAWIHSTSPDAMNYGIAAINSELLRNPPEPRRTALIKSRAAMVETRENGGGLFVRTKPEDDLFSGNSNETIVAFKKIDYSKYTRGMR